MRTKRQQISVSICHVEFAEAGGNASQQEEGLGWKVSVSPVEGGRQPLLGEGGFN